MKGHQDRLSQAPHVEAEAGSRTWACLSTRAPWGWWGKPTWTGVACVLGRGHQVCSAATPPQATLDAPAENPQILSRVPRGEALETWREAHTKQAAFPQHLEQSASRCMVSLTAHKGKDRSPALRRVATRGLAPEVSQAQARAPAA